jgi:EAL domain-containing protein (putative c-di-GMP-specific phosphodiesterase class I)
MITNACKQNKDWQKQGLEPIFISAIQLNAGKVVKAVEKSLEASQLSPKYLELELTETAMITDIPVGIGCLQELKNMGVLLALDDFGTGYSSISNLRQLQLDYLKIDKSFISNIPENKEDALTVNSIITLAHHLKIKVTAVGVETLQQLEFVQNSNCDRLQGYFVSKPVSEDKFRELLLNKNIQL